MSTPPNPAPSENGYGSNLTLEQAADWLAAGRRTLLTTHAKPDGDALGSVLALSEALRQRGMAVQAWLMPPVPEPLMGLPGAREQLSVYEPQRGVSPDLSGVDRLVVLDTGAWAQLTPMRPLIEPLLDRALIVDHHLSGDVPAARRYIDQRAAACCEIVAQLLELLVGVESAVPSQVAAHALFTGVAADTGWFRFSNTRPQSHELAAQLIRQGVDQAWLYEQLEQTARPQKLALQVRAMQSLRLLADQRAAVMTLRPEDFTQTGALAEETERFVDIPRSVQSVRVSALITQAPEPSAPVRVSFRSKPGHPEIDVSRIARGFGGGGHARAAAAKLGESLDRAVDRVCQALEDALAEAQEDASGNAPGDAPEKAEPR